jgi:hypothetical protein
MLEKHCIVFSPKNQSKKKIKKKKNSKPNQVGEKEKGEINQSLNYGDLALRIQTTPHVPPHLKL